MKKREMLLTEEGQRDVENLGEKKKKIKSSKYRDDINKEMKSYRIHSIQDPSFFLVEL